jgi:hypothetical protein
MIPHEMPYHPIILQLNQNNTKNTNNYVNGDGQHKNQDNQKYSKINGRWLCPARFETKNSLVAWKCLLLHARAGYQLCRVCSSMRRINCLTSCCIYESGGGSSRHFKQTKFPRVRLDERDETTNETRLRATRDKTTSNTRRSQKVTRHTTQGTKVPQ